MNVEAYTSPKILFILFNQEVVSNEVKTVLKQGQYCVVLDPVNKDFKPQLGERELRVGCCSFFLHPGQEKKLTVLFETGV